MYTKISIFTIMPLNVCSFCSGSLRSEQRFLLPTCQVGLAGQRTDPDSKCGKRWFRRFVHRDGDLAGDRERLVHKYNLQFTSFVLAMFWISTYNNVWRQNYLSAATKSSCQRPNCLIKMYFKTVIIRQSRPLLMLQILTAVLISLYFTFAGLLSFRLHIVLDLNPATIISVQRHRWL